MYALPDPRHSDEWDQPTLGPHPAPGFDHELGTIPDDLHLSSLFLAGAISATVLLGLAAGVARILHGLVKK